MGGHRVYIGRLDRDVSNKELEEHFKSRGKILDVTVKDGFGFVEFEDKSDADASIRKFHETEFFGKTITVEVAKSRTRVPEDNRRSEENKRIIVRNIPKDTTWQDLKDFMGKSGRIIFADIIKFPPGEGIVEFAKREDVRHAMKELNGQKLNGSRVTFEDRGSRSFRTRSRSPHRNSRRRSPDSRSRSRSRSHRSHRSRRSPSASRSRSRSSGRSPKREPEVKDEEMREGDMVADVSENGSDRSDKRRDRSRSYDSDRDN